MLRSRVRQRVHSLVLVPVPRMPDFTPTSLEAMATVTMRGCSPVLPVYWRLTLHQMTTAQTVRSLKHLAGEMRGESDVKIPLWITVRRKTLVLHSQVALTLFCTMQGHSLGSALASLLFSRFMHMPDDLGPDMVLRDAYTYGTPRLGDADFVSAFEAACLTPIDRPSILWRVVNSFDIVCQIPP